MSHDPSDSPGRLIHKNASMCPLPVAVVGEMISANKGLGFLVVKYAGLLETSKVLGAVLVLALGGWALNALFNWAAKRCFPWLS